MTDFTISPKAENVWLESWLDLSPEEQQEMDHVEQDEQYDARFFRFEDSVYDIADFMRDDRFPDWHAGYPLNAFAMLMALNDHPVSRRLKTPTSCRQATEQPSDSLPATSCRNRTLGRLMRVAIIKPTRKQVV